MTPNAWKISNVLIEAQDTWQPAVAVTILVNDTIASVSLNHDEAEQVVAALTAAAAEVRSLVRAREVADRLQGADKMAQATAIYPIAGAKKP